MSKLGQSIKRPRFLTDANFNLHIVHGLLRRQPQMDIITAQSLQALAVSDPEILTLARTLDPIVLTHDRRTMPAHLEALLRELGPDSHSPGVVSVKQQLPVGAAIDAIYLLWACSAHEEWRDRFIFLPL